MNTDTLKSLVVVPHFIDRCQLFNLLSTHSLCPRWWCVSKRGGLCSRVAPYRNTTTATNSPLFHLFSTTQQSNHRVWCGVEVAAAAATAIYLAVISFSYLSSAQFFSNHPSELLLMECSAHPRTDRLTDHHCAPVSSSSTPTTHPPTRYTPRVTRNSVATRSSASLRHITGI